MVYDWGPSWYGYRNDADGSVCYMMQFVCVKCTGHAKGCTLIKEDSNNLPLICVDEITRKAIACEWMEVPEKETGLKLKSMFPFE